MGVYILPIVAIVYLAAVAYLGFLGYRTTRSTSDYMIAGGKAHPYVMAISYGATFISTSAIVGFGGAAAAFGMGILWLTFLNIFVGIFLAFTVFGKRTRRVGHRLHAHTFPELMGRRFNSRFIQALSGLIILVFMPLYAAAVIIGAARYIESTFVQINYPAAVTIFSLIVAAYVIAGGLKGVMYTDALQGGLMFIGMVILVFFTYMRLGGIVEAHHRLDDLPDRIEASYQEALPELRAIAPAGIDDGELFKWFSAKAGELKTTAAMDDEQRAAFMAERPELPALGALMKAKPELTNKLVYAQLSAGGFRGWTHMPETGSRAFYVLVTSIVMGVGIGVVAQPQLAVRFMTVKSGRELNRAVLVGGVFILMMTGVAFTVGNLTNVWFTMAENGGKVALASVPGGNIDLIIPEFINRALPPWFGALFMLTLLSAAMSTLSSQFHAMGTAIGRDFYERGLLGTQDHQSTVLITRIGIIVALIGTVVLCFQLPEGIVAVATAMFFGLCASAFLPMFVGGLFWRGMTKAGAIASLCVGFCTSFFWVMFVQQPKGALPALMAKRLFDMDTLLPNPVLGIHFNWTEALVVALPLSAITAVVVSLLTKPESEEHLTRCFGNNH